MLMQKQCHYDVMMHLDETVYAYNVFIDILENMEHELTDRGLDVYVWRDDVSLDVYVVHRLRKQHFPGIKPYWLMWAVINIINLKTDVKNHLLGTRQRSVE